jgi:predicted N-acetyltransferase YhbS
MFRLMQPGDLEAAKALYSQAFGESDALAQAAICRFGGEKNVYVAEENGAVAAMLMLPPVHIRERLGVYVCGVAVDPAFRGRGLATEFLNFAAERAVLQGASFAALIPEQPELFGFYEKRGFQKAFVRRNLTREIKRNIWSQAEFDSVPAGRLSELRARYCPDVVQMPTSSLVQELTELYSRGITIVSGEEGYGLYFREGETLRFIELMADGDRAAERMMEAAREKEVVVERAEITVNAAQNLFLGEGVREAHGMIRFFGDPFDISESYLGLMLDV